MRGPVIVRGVLELVRAGLPAVLIAGVISALIKGRVQPGWEFRLPLAIVIVAGITFGLGIVLRRWSWISSATSESNGVPDA